MDKSFISFDIQSTSLSKTLSIQVRLDQHVVYENTEFLGAQTLRVEIPDDEATHDLHIQLTGKTAQHTVLDSQGQIIEDVVIQVENLKFDDILVGHNIMQLAVYEHDFNGTGQTVQDQFYGSMGCNGTVTLQFSTPVYLWLLENM